MATGKESEWSAILELMRDFDVVFFTTVGRDRALHARPMYIAELTSQGGLAFLTDEGTEKIDEIIEDDRAVVTMQDSRRYVVLSGRVLLTRRPERVRHLWKDRWKVWFPKGPDDPSLAIIEFMPERGEYWDLRGKAGLKFAWEAIKAYASSRPMDRSMAGGHGTAGTRGASSVG